MTCGSYAQTEYCRKGYGDACDCNLTAVPIERRDESPCQRFVSASSPLPLELSLKGADLQVISWLKLSPCSTIATSLPMVNTITLISSSV